LTATNRFRLLEESPPLQPAVKATAQLAPRDVTVGQGRQIEGGSIWPEALRNGRSGARVTGDEQSQQRKGLSEKLHVDIYHKQRYHIIMTRTVVAIDDDIKKWIDAKAAQEGVPMTELVRRALQQYREHEEQSVERLLSETSGIWMAGDGLNYQQNLREEWGQ
jgi:hypothetical protein